MSKCPIMSRMKTYYEKPSTYYLTKRIPVIMRLDGRAFHTYTKKLNKPFDDTLIHAMQQTAKYVCENISGAKLAYTQSDEISILITDYDSIGTQAWFDYNVAKMISASTSDAVFKFNQIMFDITGIPGRFDCRVHNIPEHDVNNYFVARQKDCIKNSISQVANTVFSAKELDTANSEKRLEMLTEKGNHWINLPDHYKYGTIIHRVQATNIINGHIVIRRPFEIVNNVLFKENKTYIQSIISNDYIS